MNPEMQTLHAFRQGISMPLINRLGMLCGILGCFWATKRLHVKL